MKTITFFLFNLITVSVALTDTASATYKYRLPTYYVNVKTLDGHPVKQAEVVFTFLGSSHYVGMCKKKGAEKESFGICKKYINIDGAIAQTDERGNAGFAASTYNLSVNDNTLLFNVRVDGVVWGPKNEITSFVSNVENDIHPLESTCSYSWNKKQLFQSQMHCILNLTKEELDKRTHL